MQEIRNNEKSTRASNFELLRIIAMIFIIMGHFVSQSSLSECTECKSYINLILGSAPRIMVNVFLILGTWFLVDTKIKIERITRLYLETALYCIGITAIMLISGQECSTRSIIQGFLPFFGRPVWFASAYLSLLIIAPFLQRTFYLSHKHQSVLIGLSFALYSVVSTIPASTPIDYIADFTWFIVVFLCVGWIKHSQLYIPFKLKWTYLLGALFIYGTLCALKVHPVSSAAASYWLDNIKSLPNIGCAILIFLFFKNIDLGSRRLINTLARSTFAVYVIHQVPAFHNFEWNVLLQAPRLLELNSATYALVIPSMACILFLVYTGIDMFRLTILEPIYAKSMFFSKITYVLASFYNKPEIIEDLKEN